MAEKKNEDTVEDYPVTSLARRGLKHLGSVLQRAIKERWSVERSIVRGIPFENLLWLSGGIVSSSRPCRGRQNAAVLFHCLR